jgi:hypothetical protein
MDLTISIVNYNSREYLQALLQSIFSSTTDASFEIIVVDNNSRDGSLEWIKSNYPEIKLVLNNENLGFAKAQNKGISASTGKFVLLLNPDSTVKPDAIQNMIDFMKTHPEAGAIGGKILNPDGTIQLSGKKFPTPLAAILLSLGIHKLFPNNPVTRNYYMPKESYDSVHEAEHVMGSFLMARKSAIDKVGLLDEGFFLYCEDVDWCMRLIQGGFNIYYLPSAVAVHHKGGSSKKDSYKNIIEHHKSLWRFYKKWYYKNYPQIISFLFYFGLIARKWVYLMINLFSREKKVRY